MSEVQSRPAATRGGRGGARGGRGGYSGRGGARSNARLATDEAGMDAPSSVTVEDQGELGQLKKQYGTQLVTLSELFPDWTDEDLVFALQETNGDVESTVDRIASGSVSRFSDVKKKTKEKSRTKPKDNALPTSDGFAASGRGRGRGGLEGGRGGRGRGGSERGRGGSRAGRGGVINSLNGSRTVDPAASTSTSEAWNVPATTVDNSWNTPNTTSDQAGADKGGSISGGLVESGPIAAAEVPKSSLIPEKATKSWASMLAQSTAPPPVIRPPVSEPVVAAPEQPAEVPEIIPVTTVTAADLPTFPSGAAYGADTYDTDSLRPEHDLPTGQASYDNTREGSIDLSPPKDQLTEENVDNLPDSSIPLATETVASTADAQSNAGSMTPFNNSQQTTATRPPVGGYATSAWRSSGLQPGRASSYQRKIMEQQEAVVMPVSHSVDRAAVQFGSLGLNGENDTTALDADEEREDVETRAQPPQQSPPSQPRASLPPPPFQHSIPAEQTQLESHAPKQAPGFPAKSQPAPSAAPGLQAPTQSGSQQNQAYDQLGRYTAGSIAQDSAAPSQKPYDPFNQQLGYQSQSEQTSMYPSHSQSSHQPGQPPSQPHLGGYSQGPNDYSSQYSGNERGAYQNYYGSSYGQQTAPSQQDQSVAPQRSTSSFGVTDSTYSTGQTTQTSSRFAEASTSGNTTPNPTQHQLGSQYQGQHQQSHGHGGHSGGFPPYGNPYYGNSYYGTYMNQYPSQYSYNQGGYGGHYGGKGNMYGQPHHGYGTSPQASYDHPTSSTSAGGFGGRETSSYAGLNDYGRQGQGQSGSSFASQDTFGRNQSGYSSQNQSQQYSQQANTSSEDALKAYPDAKTGPSPSLGLPGRTGSAANNSSLPTSSQTGFPPPQSQQQGFGGYPGHLNHPNSSQNSQYGGLGGLGAHQSSSQSHQSSNYGNYGAAGFGGSYGNYGRGGWGSNYGGH